MKEYRLKSTPAVELDIEAAFEWYEREEFHLGFEFLDEVPVTAADSHPRAAGVRRNRSKQSQKYRKSMAPPGRMLSLCMNWGGKLKRIAED